MMTASDIYGKLDFPLLLLLGEWLVAQFFPKRRYFPLRCILSFVVVCGFNISTFYLNKIDGFYTTPLVLFEPLVLFLLSLLGLVFCFKASLPSYLMAATIGYSMQNPSYCLASLVRLAIGFDADEQWYFMLLILLCIFPVYYFILYHLYLKDPNRRKGIHQIKEKRQIIITFVSVSALSVLSSLGMKGANETGFIDMWIYVYLANIAIGVISVTSELELLTSRRSLKEATRIKTMYQKDKESFKQAKDNIEMVNIKMHDLRHKIDNLSNRLDEGEIKELKTDMEGYVQIANTNCSAFDLVLQEKSIVLANEGIRFTCFLDASLLNYIPKESLYSLFENALSNAIEAVRPLPVEKRVISVIGSNFKDYFTIHMENYCKDDNPLTSLETTKEDKANHGFGLKSIFMIMNQYDGKYKLTKKDGVFSLDLLFHIPSKEEGQEGI